MMMGAQKFNLLRFLQNEVFQRRILHFWKKVFSSREFPSPTIFLQSKIYGESNASRDTSPTPCTSHDATGEISRLWSCSLI